jgi:hypothetical protein
VRRTLAIEALVILQRGLLTPADIGVLLALDRQHGRVTTI